jgi:hypothetical protein
MAATASSDGPMRRWLRLLTWPFHAVWQFGHWVRHSSADTEAVYGPNPNEITEDEKAVNAGMIAGLGGGSGQHSGF